MHDSISVRYRNDGVALLPLNALQIRLRDQLEAKVRLGVYPTEPVRCVLCDSVDGIPLAEKDRYGFSCRIVICPACGLIYTTPRMTQDAYASFYDDEYRPLYHGNPPTAEEMFASEVARAKQLAGFLRAQGVSLDGLRVLEVGCGAGGTLAYLRDTFGCSVRGCDFGSAGVRYAAEWHGLELHVGDLESVRLPWQPDLIIYAHVFEHILDLPRECYLIRCALSNSGLVCIEVPGVKNIRLAYEWDFLRSLQNAHTYYFTLTTLTNVMRKHGLHLHAGTEQVRALFRKGEPATDYVNDYASVTKFLTRTERLRPLVKLGIVSRRLPRRAAVALVMAAGLKPFVKRVMLNASRSRVVRRTNGGLHGSNAAAKPSPLQLPFP